MNPAALNDLALLAIGLGLGLALALVACMTFCLLWFAWRLREHSRLAHLQTKEALALATSSTDRLRSDVTLALSRMDAERLYEASVQVQRSSRSLSAQVALLNKAVFAGSGYGPGLDLGNLGSNGNGSNLGPLPESFTLDDEAMDDERMLREAGRWNGGPTNHLNHFNDPLAGLSEEEKNVRVNQFFEQRRRERAGSPSPSAVTDIHPVGAGAAAGGGPPVAGSGAYTSLVDLARERQDNPQPPAAPDLGEVEAGELTDMRELQ